MKTDEIRIVAQPLTEDTCVFTVDRPVYPESSYYFPSKEVAAEAPLAAKIFAINGVASVLITHDTVTVRKSGLDDWRTVGRQVGTAIREHLASGEPAVSESLKEKLPTADEIRERVQQVLDRDINPAVSQHGGIVQLLDVRNNDIFIQMGGGCQGCGMAHMTLRHGVETAIRRHVPEVGAIFDQTDHASGRNPYYAS